MSHFDSLNDQALTAVLLRLPYEQLEGLIQSYPRVTQLTQQDNFWDTWKKVNIETIQSYDEYDGSIIRLTDVYKSDMQTQHGSCIKMDSDTLQVIESVEYVKGLKHGPSKRWTKKGFLLETSNYKEGKREGISKLYHKHGDIQLIEYKDGLPHGKHIVWYGSGSISQISTYKDGYTEDAKYWRHDGTKEYEMTKDKSVHYDKFGLVYKQISEF
jgi:antitoxin component YwqK of YwqJK toxin-antitoxin module